VGVISIHCQQAGWNQRVMKDTPFWVQVSLGVVGSVVMFGAVDGIIGRFVDWSVVGRMPVD